VAEIRQLDSTTIDRIAAGEVVERPASVVKELLENSIDADASRVTVRVENGGTDRIVVSDDGVGMDSEAAELAIEEHTTSKIRDIDDLEAGVSTLGFRGEALHAIGSVARVTIRTRPRGGARGTEVVVEGGEVREVGPAGCPEGTTIEVEDLFFNVPARRKYLKQDATEFSHVNAIATGYALAEPDVAVTLEHNGRETFATPGQDDRRAAVMAVYGREVAANMIPVEAAGDGPLDGVTGLVSHPETNRASRDYLNTFVNGRYVTASAVREAVVSAYDTQLAPDRYPFAVLDLAVPANTVDVNVHPRKLEVRFAAEEGVKAQVERAVREALLEEGLLRSSAPRGRSQAAQTEISPERSESEDSTTTHRISGSNIRPQSRDSQSHREPRSAGDTESSAADRAPDARTAPAWDPTTEATGSDSGGGDGGAQPPDRKFRAEPTQATFGDAPALGEEAFERLPALRVLGQLHDTYLVAETADGLVLVDQHAADERVNFERLRERFAGAVTTQALAEPVAVELTAREAALFADHGEALARLGFHAELSGRTVHVTTMPALLADVAGPDLVRDILSDFVGGDPAATVEAAADDLLGDLACYPSIKGNESLTEGSVLDLLRALDACENPYACPHGRPTVIELSRGEIEDRFERDYPGHQGRRAE
jgi:DNA mismatch repair protein MutL